MNDIEFSKKIIKLLSEEELQIAVKQATLKGLKVPGYKNAWKAPKTQISAIMKNQVKKGVWNSGLLINAVAQMYEGDGKLTITKLAKLWIDGENTTDIERDIDLLEKVFAEQKLADDITEKNDNNEVEDIHNQIVEFEKIKKQQQDILQENKILIKNLEKM